MRRLVLLDMYTRQEQGERRQESWRIYPEQEGYCISVAGYSPGKKASRLVYSMNPPVNVSCLIEVRVKDVTRALDVSSYLAQLAVALMVCRRPS